MNKTELIKELEKLHGDTDIEIAHSRADDLLIDFINDEKITKAYNLIEKWYA